MTSSFVDKIDLVEFAARIPGRLARSVVAIDSHTQGEATRVVIAPPSYVKGETLSDKRHHLMEHGDQLRRVLTYEPRGHRDLIAAVITEPVTEGAAFGVIFMDSYRFPYACGTATVGAVTTLVEMGLVEPQPDGALWVDTPAGVAKTRVETLEDGGISVALVLPPAFVFGTGQPVHLDGTTIAVDTVFVGGFLAVVSAETLGLNLAPDNEREIAAMGMALIEAANADIDVQHPQRPSVRTIDGVVITADASYSRSAVVYGDAHVDRSPCGTGTVAKMALLHHRGTLEVGARFLSEGLLGTQFEGCIVSTCREAGRDAISGQITARAYLTGVHQFVVDPADPLGDGFLVRSAE